jgi:hypothetical protein
VTRWRSSPAVARSPTAPSATFQVEPDGDRIRVEIAADRADRVTRALVAQNHFPSELRPVETTLEDAYFALTDPAAGGDRR